MPNDGKRYIYTHDNKKDMMAFTSGIMYGEVAKADARNGTTDLLDVFNGVALSGTDGPKRTESAERVIFGLLMSNINDLDLISTLTQNYKGKGMEAIQYIQNCFDHGDNDDRLSDANDGYFAILFTNPLTPSVTVEEFNTKCNELRMYAVILVSSPREISIAMQAANLIDWVKKIDAEYKSDVRYMVGKMSNDDKKLLVKVQPVLEGIIRTRNTRPETKKSMPSTAELTNMLATRAQAGDAEAIAHLKKVVGGPSNGKKLCPHCQLVHAGPFSQCMALLRSQGKTPPGWDKMEQGKRDRIDERAAKITEPPKIGLIDVLSMSATEKSTNVNVVGVPLYVDSQGGTGTSFHFINDKSLFSTIDYDAAPVDVGGVVGKNKPVQSVGRGTCKVWVTYDDGCGHVPVTVALDLVDCILVPDIDFNIYNVSAGAKRGIKCTFGEDNFLEFPDGSRIPMENDYTLRIAPRTETTLLGTIGKSVITRGNVTHIDAEEMSPRDSLKFELAHNLLNHPAPQRAKDLHKVMENVPKILQKSNFNNTYNEPRMLANSPSLPAPPSAAHATRVGELTQMDGWDAGLVSLLGNRYMIDFYDAYSTDIEFHFAKKKSDFPSLVNRYFLELLQTNPDAIKLGGVLYSDNEVVLNSQAMADVADRWNRTRETSVEYRATSNAGAESPFRIGPNEMRKVYVMTGVPPVLYEFVAIEAARALRWLRLREGKTKTPGELKTGERADFNKYIKNGTFGCMVIARRPVAWRDNKHQARAVEGVNLGRARNQPGWHIYTEEYGIMTSADVTLARAAE